VIPINKKIGISEDEITFVSSRSSGPGGQNVNKLNTRITLLFNVADCGSLTDLQKKRILKQLSTRIDKNGCLRVVSQKHRTQKANRSAAIKRFQELLADALRVKPRRKKTTIPFSVKKKRLEEKRKHSLLKRQRTDKDFEF